jgi:hypothetical protein
MQEKKFAAVSVAEDLMHVQMDPDTVNIAFHQKNLTAFADVYVQQMRLKFVALHAVNLTNIATGCWDV